MTHYSQVSSGVFAALKARRKIIEPRLNDDAHKKVRLGDLLLFTDRTTGQELLAKVVGVLRYPSFVELFNAFPPSHFGATNMQAAIDEVRQWYSPQSEKAHGVLGLKLHILKKEAIN